MSSTKYFSDNDTLFDITEKYPQTIKVFVANGFPDIDDPVKRATLGKNISLKQALQIKGKSIQLYFKLLSDSIENENRSVDISMRGSENKDAEVSIVGALPCPVRIPLLEQLDTFMVKYRERYGVSIKYDLKAASQGTDWIAKYVHEAGSADELPDLFISAGFEMFFDHNTIGKYKDEGAFEDMLPFNGANSDFDSIDIRDPKHDYSIISVVPAVFLVNTEELGDIPIPQSWEDILLPHFAKRISLPVGDFDMFSAILIHIYKTYGDEGIRALGRNLMESMHPSEMVKSAKKKGEKPIVTIMPYFFTKMTKIGGPLISIWPKDGAIISPIFLLTKRNPGKEIRPLVDFFASKEVGEMLSHKGLFPSLNPEVNNNLEKGNNYLWVGWDYIYNNDIPVLIKKCEQLFNEAVK